jgi:hypothetical protein
MCFRQNAPMAVLWLEQIAAAMAAKVVKAIAGRQPNASS